MVWGVAGKEKSVPLDVMDAPIILVGQDGKRFWGMIRQAVVPPIERVLEYSIRDLQMMKNTPIAVTAVDAGTGRVLYQNTASMAMMGKREVLD